MGFAKEEVTSQQVDCAVHAIAGYCDCNTVTRSHVDTVCAYTAQRNEVMPHNAC